MPAIFYRDDRSPKVIRRSLNVALILAIIHILKNDLEVSPSGMELGSRTPTRSGRDIAFGGDAYRGSTSSMTAA
jgi:hypothetical protein